MIEWIIFAVVFLGLTTGPTLYRMNKRRLARLPPPLPPLPRVATTAHAPAGHGHDDTYTPTLKRRGPNWYTITFFVLVTMALLLWHRSCNRVIDKVNVAEQEGCFVVDTTWQEIYRGPANDKVILCNTYFQVDSWGAIYITYHDSHGNTITDPYSGKGVYQPSSRERTGDELLFTSKTTPAIFVFKQMLLVRRRVKCQ